MTFQDWELIAEQNRQLSALAESGDMASLRTAIQAINWDLPKMTDFDFYAEHCRHTWGPPVADVEQIVAWTPENAKVLDVGFGYGHVLRALDNGTRSLHGIDSCSTAADLLRTELPKTFLVIGDVCEMGDDVCRTYSWWFPGFDIIVCMEVVEHLSPARCQRALQNIAALLWGKESRLLLSTRINENLGRSLLACPHCGDVIHPAGHVRSFSETLLFAELYLAGWWVAKAVRSPGGILLKCAKLS